MSIKLAILVSGRGSNLEAILQAIKDGSLSANVEIVVSNKEGAGALEIAKSFGIRAKAISNDGLKRVEHEEKLLDEIEKRAVQYVVLAGYMRVLSPFFLRHFRDPAGFYNIINIHPSLLPAFPGKDAYGDAFAANVPQSGITVHLVDEEVDHGPILAQQKFPRLKDDTLETFKHRGLQVEHKLFPAVLHKVASQGLASLIKEPVVL